MPILFITYISCSLCQFQATGDGTERLAGGSGPGTAPPDSSRAQHGTPHISTDFTSGQSTSNPAIDVAAEYSNPLHPRETQMNFLISNFGLA